MNAAQTQQPRDSETASANTEGSTIRIAREANPGPLDYQEVGAIGTALCRGHLTADALFSKVAGECPRRMRRTLDAFIALGADVRHVQISGDAWDEWEYQLMNGDVMRHVLASMGIWQELKN